MFTLNCKGRILEIDRPAVMGIINATPDSFYRGSRHEASDQVLFTAEKMLNEGAAILDIGGQSTRPGSERVSEEEELRRVIPAIEAVHLRFPQAFLSIDTYYSKVARLAVHAGAAIINDISGGSLDQELISEVARLRVPYVLTHMKGVPQHMQDAPAYNDVVLEVYDYLASEISRLHALGIHDIIIDPGFGFGKTIANNFEILRKLQFFTTLNHALMVGVSRKGSIYKTLGTTADQALNGTTVLHTIALMNGAHILRAHDVKEAVEAITLVEAVKK